MALIERALPSSYDEVPYPTTSHIFTHPDNLATAATLLGLEPTPVEHCRVLELGCASGGNLIPMTLELSDSELVGIDASAVQIAEGQTGIAAIGAKNITLQHLNILDITPELGKFDYIIVHGIFSWVPDAVRDKILAVCRQSLMPNGIAYISYNTYPGWHMLKTVREMMLYHTRNISEPNLRIAKARALLEFLANSLATASEHSNSQLVKAYSGFLQSEKTHISDSTDSYVFHEELEEINDPIYFHQFADWATQHQLQYLCEANLSDVFLNDFAPQVTNELLKMAHNLIELEQYMDFLRNRTFRKTLLVHQEAQFARQFRPERVFGLYAATHARPASEKPDIRSIAVEEFTSSEGLKFATDHPVTKAALQYLAQVWPLPVGFDELIEKAYERLGQGSPDSGKRTQDRLVLAANLLKGYTYSGRLIELHTYAPRFTAQVSERPIASSWARFQTHFSNDVTNLCHVRVELKGIAQYLLPHLDGTHDRGALVDGLEKSLASGALVRQATNTAGQPNDPPVDDGTPPDRDSLLKDLETTLQGFAEAALLIA